jgi:hypothetical protein
MSYLLIFVVYLEFIFIGTRSNGKKCHFVWPKSNSIFGKTTPPGQSFRQATSLPTSNAIDCHHEDFRIWLRNRQDTLIKIRPNVIEVLSLVFGPMPKIFKKYTHRHYSRQAI